MGGWMNLPPTYIILVEHYYGDLYYEHNTITSSGGRNLLKEKVLCSSHSRRTGSVPWDHITSFIAWTGL